jgi:hypothetical protein
MRPETQHSLMKIKAKSFSANQLSPLALPLCVLVVLAISACGGNATATVDLMPNSAQTLEPGKSLPIAATLSNDPERKGVSWTLAGTGVLVAQTTTSVMYQAPSIISTQESVTVTATPIAGRRPTTLTIRLVQQKPADSDRRENPDHKSEGAAR